LRKDLSNQPDEAPEIIRHNPQINRCNLNSYLINQKQFNLRTLFFTKISYNYKNLKQFYKKLTINYIRQYH
jgi:hypothetical protein